MWLCLFVECLNAGIIRNLKEALIEAALVLIREKGPTGFTLSEAANAGVTPAAVYRHFEGREDLIAEAALQG